MKTRFTPEELANKILQIAISNANKPNAKETYIILTELKITKEIKGEADCKHISFSGIEEKFQVPIALALNASYRGLIRYSDNTNGVTYKVTKKVFEEQLLPDIEATYQPVVDYFKKLFARKFTSSKKEVITASISLKAPTV